VNITAPATSATTTIDVARLIDEGQWTSYQKWLLTLVAVTIVFDGVDNQLLGIALPAVMAEWGLPRSAFAPVISLSYVGMMIGGALAGIIGDRVGRRAALLGSVVVFGVMTAAVAFADSPTSLMWLRCLAGLGLGGAMPNAAALAAEYSPSRIRPFAVTLTIVCVPLGGTVAGLLALQALPAIGWRSVFIVGGVVPIIAAIVLRWFLPESPHFLARLESRQQDLVRTLRAMGHVVPAHAVFATSAAHRIPRARLASLFSTELRADTIALWCAFLSCMLSVYLGFAWLTSLLTSAGFDGATASTGITVFNLGGVVGAILGGLAIARVGSKPAILCMAAIAVASAVVLAFMPLTPATSRLLLIAMITVLGGAINAVQTTMYALATHVYPTFVRATGVGTAVAVGRTGAVLSGYVGSWLIDFGGAPAYFGAIAAMMTGTFISLAAIRQHVRGSGVPRFRGSEVPGFRGS
jgi:AAHS family 4-hydroxybenzoate transporter-like MFS transporter